MDIDRFDTITRLFAQRRSRRAALRGGGLGLATAAFGALGARAAAQDATPAALPDDPHPSADAPAQPELLFVQPFGGGTWAPKAGEDGIYTLILTGAPAQTVYFSDRPDRIFGFWPTQQFLDNLGFTPANPPNAAVVARAEGGDQEVLVVELLNPAYDAATDTLTYDATVLADYDEDGLAYAARQQTDYALPETFGEGGLFIDGLFDCSSNGCGTCYQIVNGAEQPVGLIQTIAMCGHIVAGTCRPCDEDGQSGHYGKLCAEAYPNQCSYSDASWDCFVNFSCS